MSQSLQWTANVQLAGKTEIALSRSISVEAVDSIKIIVRGTAFTGGPDTDKQVDLQPGGSGQVSFLAIVSDRYGDTSNFLSFKVDNAANPAIRMDEPVVLAGAGLIETLDPANPPVVPPTALFFSSTLAADASNHSLVGRDATP